MNTHISPLKQWLRAGQFAIGLSYMAGLPLTSNAAGLAEYQQLKAYGVQLTAPATLADIEQLLDHSELYYPPLDSSVAPAVHRFLVYDALKHYLGFLLHINPKPGPEYFNRFTPLHSRLQGRFVSLHRDAVQTAISLARELRFDVSMVQMTSKEIYNQDNPLGIEGQISALIERLSSISTTLAQRYPASEGLLPPILLAYVSSVFTPRTEAERIACATKFSAEVKEDVFRILATQELDGMGQLLQSPVTYNITPMGSISSKARKLAD